MMKSGNKFYLLIAAVLTFLFSLPPTQTLAQESIIDRLDKSLGVKLPAEYEAKVKEFAETNKIMKDEGSNHFIEQFIGEQMKTDWGIDRQNQLLFVWHSIYKQITKNDLYDTNDRNQQRLKDYSDTNTRISICGQSFKNKFKEYINNRKAEADRQIAAADQQIAAADQQSVDKGLEALTKIINGFEKYITSFQNMINLDGATQTLANFNQEKNTLLQRAEKLRSGQQSNQHPSATEAENLKKTEDQLLLDITKQRTDVVKQINTVIEKNIPEIEKHINSTAQNNEEAQQQLDKAKQRYAEAQRAISDSKLATAEDRLRSTMALLMSEEYRVKTIKSLNESLNLFKEFYLSYKQSPNEEQLRKFKENARELVPLWKKYEVDYKKTLTPEMLKFYGIE